MKKTVHTQEVVHSKKVNPQETQSPTSAAKNNAHGIDFFAGSALLEDVRTLDWKELVQELNYIQENFWIKNGGHTLRAGRLGFG
jgi:hypothetical protein